MKNKIILISFITLMLLIFAGIYSMNNSQVPNKKIKLSELTKTKKPKKVVTPTEISTDEPTETPTIEITPSPTKAPKTESILPHKIGGKLSELEEYLNEKANKNNSTGQYDFKQNKIQAYGYDLVESIYLDVRSIDEQSALTIGKTYLPDDAVSIKSEKPDEFTKVYYYKSQKLLNTKINNTGYCMIVMTYNTDNGIDQIIVGEGNNP